jgi:hypothetical protein
MDVLTLGLWEVVGTPIEAFLGEKYRLTVLYDAHDRVVATNQSPVPGQRPDSLCSVDIYRLIGIDPNQHRSFRQRPLLENKICVDVQLQRRVYSSP